MSSGFRLVHSLKSFEAIQICPIPPDGTDRCCAAQKFQHTVDFPSAVA